MFSEPTLNSVNHLFNAPGMGLEMMASGVLAVGVVCYLARVAVIALSHARRMELQTLQALPVPVQNMSYNGPYCAG